MHRHLALASLLIALVSLAAACGSAPPPPVAATRMSQPRPSPVTRTPAAGDADGDGIPDAVEERLAQRYAPIVYHAPNDPYRQTNVDDFLAATTLGYYDASCGRRRTNYGVVEAQTIARHVSPESCNRASAVSSGGTLSLTKRRTFYLADPPAASRRGSDATERWATYYHAYPNNHGGVTLQFWRLYFERTRSLAGVSVGGQAGDWEGLHIVLDGAERPIQVRLLGDEHLDTYPWEQTTREGDHVIVFADRGSHATLLHGSRLGIRHETWTSPRIGTVRWPDGKVTSTGPLVNVGEKTRPFQPFIQYSGLWSEDGAWGPAYHATDRGVDYFITVWCAGHATPGSSADGAMECYPASTTP